VPSSLTILVAALLLFLLTLPPSPAPIAITGVTVIDGTGAPPVKRTLLIRNGQIAAIADPRVTPPSGYALTDGAGKFAIPGLWDMHVHLAVRPEPALAERTMFPMFLAYGIVGIRDMGGPLERVLALRDRVRRGELDGPRILTPGPFIDGPGEDDGAFRRVADPAQARAAVDALAAAGVDFVKVQANLSLEAWRAVVDEAGQRKLAVVGHVPVSIPAAVVVDGGQRSIEHISPALVGDAGLLFACSSRETELHAELVAIERDRAAGPADVIRRREAALRTALVDSYDAARAAAVGRAIARKSEWMVPTLIWSNSFRPLSASDTGADLPLDLMPAETRARWLKGRTAHLQAASAADFESAARAARVAAEAVGDLHRAGAPVLAGTDTLDAFDLPGISLHQELALLVGAGLTPMEAIQAATRNAAAYRGALRTEGTLERGKQADIILLDADPLADIRNTRRIAAVVQGGRLRTRSDLDHLLAAARDDAK
jgi:imidazolonepropionase-like amidohydrolase